MVYKMRIRQEEKGYSLIELLVVVAILAVVMAVAAFSYRTAMRASRVKQGLSDLYDGFSRARSQAIMHNGSITVAYNPGNRTVTFTQNGTVSNRIVMNDTSVDPGNPKDGADYHFESYTVIRSNTRGGATTITGLDVDDDGANDNIPILADAAVNITIQQTGFINGVADASGVLLMHQGDIDDNDASGERQYALIIFSTGLLKKARHMPDGTWELF